MSTKLQRKKTLLPPLPPQSGRVSEKEATIKVKYMAISDMKPNPRNPRIIKGNQFEQLCQSIKNNVDFFEARPVICSNRLGENIIIAGNQRYQAAKKLGFKEVPAVVMEGLTEEREREIAIRDNIINGEWDFDLLSSDFELPELKNWGLDLSNFEAPEFKKYDEDVGDSIQLCKCLTCGHEHVSKKD